MELRKISHIPGNILEWFRVKNFLILGGELTAIRCGHKTRKKWEVFAHGRFRGDLTISLNEQDEVEYCADCLSEQIARCAKCGELIVPGDPIVLYKAVLGFDPPEYAVSCGEGESYRCAWCLRNGCGFKADRNAFWVSPGRICQVLSPADVFGTANAFVVDGEDIFDIRKAILVDAAE